MRGSKRSANGFRLLAVIAVVATLAAWIFLFRLYEENFGSALSEIKRRGERLANISEAFDSVVGILCWWAFCTSLIYRDAVAEARRTQRGQRRDIDGRTSSGSFSACSTR
jgi:hypothetical protein